MTNGIATDTRDLRTLRAAAAAKIKSARADVKRVHARHKCIRILLEKATLSRLSSALQVRVMSFRQVWHTIHALLQAHAPQTVEDTAPLYSLLDMTRDALEPDAEVTATVEVEKEEVVALFFQRGRAAEKKLRKLYARKCMLVTSHEAQLRRLKTMYGQ